MKIILSRKGFDSEYGGCASPILPDGTMISMPIPSETGNCKFSDLAFVDGRTYMDVWCDLDPKGNHFDICHLDPDIRPNIRTNTPNNWKPAFGQMDQSQTHLENQNVQIGDLFLFFGWFRQTEYKEEHLKYVPNAPDIQAIYGYLQIGEILKGTDVKKCPWHPHSEDSHIYNDHHILKNNSIYIASPKFVINNEDTGLPGAGTIQLSENCVLTAEGKSRSRWKLNGVFGEVPLTYHSDNSVNDDYFQSAKKGQEFVFNEDDKVTKWVKSIIIPK